MVKLGQFGVYVLVLENPRMMKVSIGERFFEIPQGTCVYCGSAMGPGGVKARVARHLRIFSGEKASRPHWHIDRLLAIASSVAVVTACSDKSMECTLAKALKARGMVPVLGFGNTDCKTGCSSHLMSTHLSGSEAVREVAIVMREMGLKPLFSGKLEKK